MGKLTIENVLVRIIEYLSTKNAIVSTLEPIHNINMTIVRVIPKLYHL